MEHTRLGRTGLSVFRLCLGTTTFGQNPIDAKVETILDELTAAWRRGDSLR